MSEESDSNVLLEKLEKWLQRKFPYLFLDHNEFGTQGVLLLEAMKSTPNLYGEYSDMKAYNEQINDAMESAVLSTSSIGGKTRNAFLVKKVMLTQMGNIIEPPKKGGLLDGFGGMFGSGGNKQQEGGFPMGR